MRRCFVRLEHNVDVGVDDHVIAYFRVFWYLGGIVG